MIFEFQTGAYPDTAATMADHINGMAGRALLSAIREGLVADGLSPTPIGAEDWGWYTDVEADMHYMIGAIVYQDDAYTAGSNAPLDCLVQVWRTEPRTLLGFIPSKREVHAPLDDPLVGQIEAVIRSLEAVGDIQRSST
ncbi:MAG: hypothetical protein AAF919_07010 [Pseudomonadota bacterium]